MLAKVRVGIEFFRAGQRLRLGNARTEFVP